MTGRVRPLAEGNPTARAQAAQILPLVMGDRARPLLEEHLTKETSKTVRKVIELGLGSAVVGDGAAQIARTLKEDGIDGYLAADGTEVLAPPPADLPGPAPLPDSVNAGYRNLLDKAYAQQVNNYEHQKERYENATAEQRKNYWKSGRPQAPELPDHRVADRYCALLASNDPIDEARIARIGNINPFTPYFRELAA